MKASRGKRIRLAFGSFGAAGTGAFAAAMVWIGSVWFLAACGGTTGRENVAEGLGSPDSGRDPTDGRIEAGSDGTMTQNEGESAMDATVHADVDEGLFDVIIPYVDRVLPEAQLPLVDGGDGGNGGVDWPNCPEDIGVGQDGAVGLANFSNLTVAAQYDDAGNPTPAVEVEYDNAGNPLQIETDDAGNYILAPGGSVCATYPWMGRLDWTNCVRQAAATLAVEVSFPPCKWLVIADAGTAMQGTGAGHPLYDLCQDLWQCMVRSSCGTVPGAPEFCLCGTLTNVDDCAKLKGTDDAGPCKDQELAAMQIDPSTATAMATGTSNFLNFNSNVIFSTAGIINQLWNNGVTANCYLEAGVP